MAADDKDEHKLSHALVQKIKQIFPHLTEDDLKYIIEMFQDIQLSEAFVNSLEISTLLDLLEKYSKDFNTEKVNKIQKFLKREKLTSLNFSSAVKKYFCKSEATEGRAFKSSVKTNNLCDVLVSSYTSCVDDNKVRVISIEDMKNKDCDNYHESNNKNESSLSINDLLKWKIFNHRPVSIQVYLVDYTSLNLYKKEINRIRTFSKFPRNATPHTFSLAAEGFFYIGSGKDGDDEVLCCFCSRKKKNWQATDVIKIVHRLMCPNCPMVTGESCDNEPYSTTSSLSQVLPQIAKINDHQREIEAIGYHKDLESDASLDVSQPISDRLKQSKHINKQRKVQIAESRVNIPVCQRKNVQASAVPLNLNCSQPADNDSLSKVVPSGVEFRESSVPVFPDHTAAASRNTSAAAASLSTEVLQSAGVKPPESSNIPQSTDSANVTSTFSSSAPENPPLRPQINSTVEPTNQQAQGTATGQAADPPTSSNTGPQIGSNTGQNGMSNRSNGPGPTYAELGIITERPKRTEYALRQKRFETFENWPRDHHLTPEDLSEAGFYYAGYGDCARCFYCGGGLRNWDDEDNVWVEHARWFPKCAYIRQQMGQAFIDAVQELNKQYTVIPFSRVTEKIGPVSAAFNLDTKEAPLKRDPAVKTIVDMGYLEKDVVEAALQVKTEFSIVSADAVLERLEKDGKQKVNPAKNLVPITNSKFSPQGGLENIQILKEKNNQLRQQTVCKICMDKEVAVVFLPCGHLVSCAECATAMKDCPVCRVNIKGVVRAFIG